MNKKGYFSWNSSLMEIVRVEKRVSKSTERPYLVAKARMVFFGNLRSAPLKRQAGKIYTMVCFEESLFELFEAGNQYTFKGVLSFDWGNTWLKITKLYDDSGNRLLRPQKNKNQDKTLKGRMILEQQIDEDEILVERERKSRRNAGWPCTEECIDCLDPTCIVNLPY